MNHSSNEAQKNIFKTIKVAAIALTLFVGTSLLFAVPAEPLTTNSSIGGPITESNTDQIKIGKIGLGVNPTISPYDFITARDAIFLDGVSSASATFIGNLDVGNVSSSNVDVYGDVVVSGTNGAIINTSLSHNQANPEPVCSNTNGTLVLCSSNTQNNTSSSIGN